MSKTSLPITLLFVHLLVCSCDALYYRLINGNNTAGVLQASYSSSTWGTVCGSFNDAAASVACSSIGLSGYVGRVVPTSLYGIGYGSIMMSNVNCASPTSSSLDYCQYTNQSATVCGHDSDVSISCVLPSQPAGMSFALLNGTYGPVMYRNSSSSSWSPVCGYNSDIASAACRSLNPSLNSYASGYSYSTIAANDATMIVSLCSTLPNVTLDRCMATFGSSSSCTGTYITNCGLVPYAARLANQSDAFTGLLEVRPADGFPWGTVCNQNITGFNPTVLCRIAGHPGTIGSIVPRPSSYGTEPASKPIYFSTLNCPSNTTSSTSSCTFSTDVSACTHDRDVFLRCDVPTSAGASSWEFVSNNNLNSYQPLLVRPNASAPWGGVCRTSLNGYVAQTACKSIGYPLATYTYTSSMSRLSFGGPVYMYNVQCDVNARNLTQCLFTTTSTSSCSSIITLNCQSTYFSLQFSGGTLLPRTQYGGLLQVRPSSGGTLLPRTQSGGLLQVRPSGGTMGWGDVCNDGTFTTANATYACNQQYFTGRVGQLTNRYGNSLLNRTLVSNFNCTGVTDGLAQCRVTQPESPCASVVGIDCIIPTTQQNTYEFSIADVPLNQYEPVLMRPNSSAPWLPICGSWSLSSNTALSLCQQLGYPTTYAYSYGSTSTGEFVGSDRYQISDLNCASPATPLQNCVQTSNIVNRIPYSQCPSLTVLYCSTTSYQNAYFLSGPNTTTGLLQTSWNQPGTLCSLPSFSGNAPNVACATVGLLGYSGALRFVGAGSGPIIESAFSCPYTNMTTLSQCTSSPPTSSCTHQNDIGLYCAVPTLTDATRLDVMRNPSNVVFVRSSASNPWASICYDSVTSNNPNSIARAVCASVGLANYSSTWSYTYSDPNQGNGGSTLYRVSCADVYNITNILGPQSVMIPVTSNNPNSIARAVCASVGLANYSSTWSYTYSDPNQGNGGSTLYRVSCADVYNITNLGQCLYSTDAPSGGCSRFLVVYCYTNSWQYALFGGPDAYSGMVAVRPSSYAPWGSVCGLGATSLVATYLCNHAGFVGYQGKVIASVGSASGPVYQSNFSCVPGNGVPTCTYNGTSANGCTSASAINIACSKPAPRVNWAYSLPSFGSTISQPFMLRPNSDSSWGYIAYGSSVSASVACNSVNPNVPTYGSTSWVYAPAGSVIYLATWGCAQDAKTVGDCLANVTTYTTEFSTSVLGLACYYWPSAWQAQIASSQSSALNNLLDISPTSGLLQVRPSSSAPWGTVCNNGFQSTSTICTQILGSLGYGLVGKSTTQFGAGSGPIYMSSLSCPTGSSGVGYCTYTNQTATASLGGCSHSNDVGIECVVPPARTGWTYQPEDGCNPQNTYCPVIATQDGQTNASKICYYTDSSDPQFQYFNSNSAIAICNSFGFAGSYSYSSIEVDGSTTEGRIGLSCASNITAVGTAQRCLQTSVSSCRYNYVVTVYCGASSWDYRLTNTQNTSSTVVGTLIATPANGQSGVVCGSGIDSTAATVACNTLGLTGTVGSVNIIAASSTGFPVVTNLLNCSFVTDYVYSSLSQCRVGVLSDASTCTTAAQLVCTIPSTTWSLQKQWSSSSYNTLYVRPNASSAWGLLCSTQVSDQTATSVCNTAFPTYSGLWSGRSSYSYISSASSSELVPLQLRCHCVLWRIKLGLPTHQHTEHKLHGSGNINRNASQWTKRCCVRLRHRLDSSDCCMLDTGTHWNCGQREHHRRVKHRVSGGDELAELLLCDRLRVFLIVTVQGRCVEASTCTTAAQLVCTIPSTTWSLQKQWSSSSYNTLYVRPNASSAWGLLCSTQVSDQTATSVCNTAFPTYSGLWSGRSSYSYISSASSVYPIYASAAACSPNASFSNCIVQPYVSTSTSGCNYFAAVSCVFTMTGFNFRLRTSDPALIGMSSSANVSFGVVELRPKSNAANNSSAWGTLCNNRLMTMPTADSLCALLGRLDSVGSFVACPTSTSADSFGMPIYARDLDCDSVEYCYGSSPHYNQDTNGYCSHRNDTCIICSPSSASGNGGGILVNPGAGSWSVALQTLTATSVDYSDTFPLLFVRPNQSMAWGHVCNGTTLGINEANMFCRWLGCTNNCRAQMSTTSLGSQYGPVFASQVRCPPNANNIGDCTFWQYTNATSACPQTDAVSLICVPQYQPSVPPNVPYTTLATNCAALFLLTSSTQAAALQLAIFKSFGVLVNVSSTASLDANPTNAQASILVMFPSTAVRNAVVAAASDITSTFSAQNSYVLGASSLSTSSPGAPASGESSSNAGVVAGSTVGAIVVLAIFAIAAYQYSRKAAQQEQEQKQGGAEIMLSNFIPPNSAQSVQQPYAVPVQGGATFTPQTGMGYAPPQPQPLGYAPQPGYAAPVQPMAHTQPPQFAQGGAGSVSINQEHPDAIEL
ncbi:membrane-associated protein, putative [Bodo saltans]|uniref:Membrane-associated protein, putative n=1 Tax=Bodo saltans TaxID=75058 RepID=A0A0S4JHT9_BODSA|nr:membrane-associated protein, putative [Bodo saltans]|eukprot:CUG89491.1 membrane-associated protein, putative [Bodo saltans]